MDSFRMIIWELGRSHGLSLEAPKQLILVKVKTMKKMVALSMLLAFGLLNSMSYAQSQDDIAKQFVGMWRLVSWTAAPR